MTAEPLHVLVVDDSEDFRDQTAWRLEAAGHRVTTASGLKAALEFLAGSRPDIAVVDLMMEHPDSGFTLCHRLKALAPPVPVILVTSVARETGFEFDAQTRDERSWVKADAILDKPVLPEQLEREIRRLAGR